MSTHRFHAVRRAATACAHLFAAAALGCAAQAALAQNVMVYTEGQTPSAQDVADILSRGASENVKQRGLNAAGGMGSPFAALEQKPVNTVREASALSVPVQFGFDSSELTPQSRQQLNAIADGIKLTEGTVKVVIEGHTDAKGRPSYNDKLSLRRAAAVRDYLVQERKLPVKLLVVEGKGAHKPLDKADPFSPRNRRVQFRAG
ncbi:OmpA family protein [Aquabacterium sp. NJ1]|uniref:OmpA family protein n=1 Tax=Aquabacterium sp. NJ1 TaxID=1538295 RepID=UPI00068A0D4E|nr:OmpA family protein [Aquabacterium sp. NJ1]